MITGRVNLYEGLFLIGQQTTAGDVGPGLERVRGILDRVEAETLALYKWDDRRLAYEIDGQKRGLFIRALFKVKGEQVAEIERLSELAEEIARVMVVRADHLGDVEIEEAKEEAKTTQAETQMRKAGDEPPASPDAGEPAQASSGSEGSA